MPLLTRLLGRRCVLPAGTVAASIPCAFLASATLLSVPAQAAYPVRAVVSRKINPAPAGAEAIRVRVFGDKSGGRMQLRLLAPGQDGVLTGYFGANPIAIDFEGWKTINVPLSEFVFRSDVSPTSAGDGIGSRENLSTANGLQIAVTSADSRLYIGDIAWTSATAGESDPAVGTLDAFGPESANAWKVVGDYEQVRAVSFGINKVPQYTKGNPASLQIVVRGAGLNERLGNKPVADLTLRKTGLPYIAYTRPVFEPIAPESIPSAEEIKTGPALSLSACPDEFEPVTFAVYSTKALKNATVAVSGPLRSAGAAPVKGAAKPASSGAASMPASAVDVRIVRTISGIDAPQVLMKDDRESLSGPLPKVRLTGDPQTDMAANTSKQFWVTVHVGRNQKPGTYKGNLVFSAPGIKPTTIPLSVEVLDLPLKTAFLQYGIDLRSRLSSEGANPGDPTVTPELLAAELANIRDHGFRLVMLHEKTASLETALRLYKEAGLSNVGPVVAADPVRDASEIAAVEGLKTSVGLGPSFDIYYGLTAEEARAGSNIAEFGAAVQKAGRGLVVAPVESTAAYASLSGALSDPRGEKLAPIYSLSSDYAQKLLAEGKRSTPNRDYWSWSIPTQNPLRNRTFAGLLLYKTGPGLYGAFPGPYQFAPNGETLTPTSDANPATRPQMTTLPVEGGVLDTVQWEAVREGVDDIRYIGVLKAYARELKDFQNPALKTPIGLAESYLIGVTGKNLLQYTPAQYVVFRRTLIKESFKLKSLLTRQKR